MNSIFYSIQLHNKGQNVVPIYVFIVIIKLYNRYLHVCIHLSICYIIKDKIVKALFLITNKSWVNRHTYYHLIKNIISIVLEENVGVVDF